MSRWRWTAGPLLGIALCALAATIKVPALAGVVFIAVAWARAEPERAERMRLLGAAALVTVAVLGGGHGGGRRRRELGLNLAVLDPGQGPPGDHARDRHRVHAVLAAAGPRCRHLGPPSRGRGRVWCAFAATAVAGVVLLWRVRISRLVRLARRRFCSSPPPAARRRGRGTSSGASRWSRRCRGAQRSAPLALALAASAFVVKPNGILALPLPSAPAVVVVYLAIAGGAWWTWRHRGDAGGAGDPGGAGGVPSVADRSMPGAAAGAREGARSALAG